MPRYRFDIFTVSPRRRLLLRGDHEQPLIPRYFDLLVFLIERRHEAVHRREIFDRVWSDVIVSDSALSQAIRTLRRALADDSRDPRFIRTVSRHGYRFVFEGVIEESEDTEVPLVAAAVVGLTSAGLPEAAPQPHISDAAPHAAVEPDFESLLGRISRPARNEAEDEDHRDVAETLHALGTAEALRRLGTRPGHEYVRALLRDTRWDLPNAGAVPLLGTPGGLQSAIRLVRLRLRRAGRITAARWMSGAAGTGAAGAFGGLAGGLLVAAAPGSKAPLTLSAVLALIGGLCGFTGGAGVSAGLAAAEAVARSRRVLALLLGGAVGGTCAGLLAQWLGHITLATLLGLDVQIGGGFDRPWPSVRPPACRMELAPGARGALSPPLEENSAGRQSCSSQPRAGWSRSCCLPLPGGRWSAARFI